MKKFGLIGYPLGHSFSKKYYLDKIDKEQVNGVHYDLYAIDEIEKFPKLFVDDPSFGGFNVTIPYKQQVIPYLDSLSPEAELIGAVNCIRISKLPTGESKLTGFNTDAFGFEQSLLTYFDPLVHKSAIVLGNGGAAQAVMFVLQKLNLPITLVSRIASEKAISYSDLTEELIQVNKLIINCTPLGTFPDVEECPDIPYTAIGSDHYLYDLIYNPEETLFLRKGKSHGAITKNGYDMLVLQAEKNWEIWTEDI